VAAAVSLTQPSGAPLQPEPILFTFATERDLSDAIGQFIAEAVEQSVARRGRFTVALAGGATASILAPSCVGHPDLQWDRWEVRPLSHSLGVL
jgi:6-phosphogluconolactonase/glucosamine-6-phosphate isomerase/deaminase